MIIKPIIGDLFPLDGGPPPLGPGFDIMVVAGQSNSQGRPGPIEDGPGEPDEPHPRIFEYGVTTRAVVQASEPLEHYTPSATGVGHALTFAKLYIADGRLEDGRDILLVPCAKEASGFSDGQWTVGGIRYDNAIAQVNEAMLEGTGFNRVVCFLWNQGEDEQTFAITKLQYERYIYRLIADFRFLMNGADETTPFICAKILPSSLRYWGPVDDAYNDLASKVPYTAVVDPAGLELWLDDLHYDGDNQRLLAQRYFELLPVAEANDLSFPVEAAATHHWLFGYLHPDLADEKQGTIATQDGSIPPVYNAGYMSVAQEIPHGFQLPISDHEDEFTLILVGRYPANTNTIMGGNFSNVGGIGGGGFAHYNLGGLRVNARGNGTPTVIDDFTTDFIFIAMSFDTVTPFTNYFYGGETPGEILPDSQGYVISNPERYLTFGNSHYATGFDGAFDISEVILFDTTLTESELNDIYLRSKNRLAGLGVGV